MVQLDIGEDPLRFCNNLTPEPAHLQDVGFVDRGHLLPAQSRQRKSLARDAVDFPGLIHHAVHSDFISSGAEDPARFPEIQTARQLPDHYEIHSLNNLGLQGGTL